MSYKPVDRQILITTEAPTTNPPNGIVYQWVGNDGFLHQLDSEGNDRRYVDLEELNTKVATSDIVDDLNSTDVDKPLSANQGKVLQDSKEDADNTILKESDVEDGLNSTSVTKPLSANQGKQLNDDKASLSDETIMAGQKKDDVDITGGKAVLNSGTFAGVIHKGIIITETINDPLVITVSFTSLRPFSIQAQIGLNRGLSEGVGASYTVQGGMGDPTSRYNVNELNKTTFGGANITFTKNVDSLVFTISGFSTNFARLFANFQMISVAGTISVSTNQ